MSLNTLQLTDRLLVDLYKNHLVEPRETSNQRPAEPAPGTIAFLGNNKSNTVIFVKYGEQTYLPDEDLQFLIKMLGACTLTLTDVAIINISKQPVTFDKVKHLQPERVLLLGIEPTELELPINFPTFKLQSYAGCTYLCCPPLYEINRDNSEGKSFKMQIWSCLKQMFEVQSR